MHQAREETVDTVQQFPGLLRIGTAKPKIDGTGLEDSRVEGAPEAWKVTARIQGKGELSLAP